MFSDALPIRVSILDRKEMLTLPCFRWKVPARHFGSVDVFLEAMQTAKPGEVLVIDNGGRLDEGCIGDLTALEAEHCGLSGIIV